jgi:hypothetical protein
MEITNPKQIERRPIHKANSFGFLVLVALLAVSQVHAQVESRAVPEAWLDSLDANLWRMNDTTGTAEYRIREVTEELNDDGTAKDVAIKYYMVKTRKGGGEQRSECDSLGHALATRQSTEKKAQASLSVENPLDAVKKSLRTKYVFAMLDPDSLGRPRMSYRLRPEEKTGFSGMVTIDTTLWIPLAIAGAPKPLPAKQMRDFHMQMEMEPAAGGMLRLHKTTLQVKGKYLFFSFRQRVVQEYYDYR